MGAGGGGGGGGDFIDWLTDTVIFEFKWKKIRTTKWGKFWVKLPPNGFHLI